MIVKSAGSTLYAGPAIRPSAFGPRKRYAACLSLLKKHSSLLIGGLDGLIGLAW